MSTSYDPRSWFPQFYTNQAVRLLETSSRWTTSGRLGDDVGAKGKAPIDMRALLDSGRIRGAWATNENCLVTLEELTRKLPAAANAAFYLHGQTDGLLVVDIEPGCPAEISANLLALPDILYAEVSMSGRGYHLITGLPEGFWEHPDATSKRVLREEHGWYEILIDHWVTFTRIPITDEDITRASKIDLESAAFTSVADLYVSLAEKANATHAAPSEVEITSHVPDIRDGNRIIEQTLSTAAPRFKTLEYFEGDYSRFEFSVLGVLHREMRRQLVRFGFVHRVTYSRNDQTWLLYEAALEVLPSRFKHSERRNGRPFLLDRAAAMVAIASDEAGG